MQKFVTLKHTYKITLGGIGYGKVYRLIGIQYPFSRMEVGIKRKGSEVYHGSSSRNG